MSDNPTPTIDTELHDLRVLTSIADTLNRAVDVQSALNDALRAAVELLGLQTGWVFLCDAANTNSWFGPGFHLGASVNLPPGLALDNPAAWDTDCTCQTLCAAAGLTHSYNEVTCSRLGSLPADFTAGLHVHASVPLRSGDETLGILNVAAPDWSHFSERALALLTHIGGQMGIALERARLYDLLHERRLLEQSTLLDLSSKLLRRTDLDDLMQFITTEATRLISVDACALLLPSRDPNFLTISAASGWRHNPVGLGRLVPADERSGSGRVMRTQLPHLIWGDDNGGSSREKHRQELPWMADWLDAEGFISSAIVPLLVDDRALGTIVVNHRQPRIWQRDDIRFLQLLANQAALALETARLRSEELAHEKIERDLELSRNIQQSLLPASCPNLPDWSFTSFYHPARQVGGDYYDFFDVPSSSHHLGIVIADVADKGISAALFMALSRSIIRASATSPSKRSPAEALLRANTLLEQENRTMQFVSVFYARLDPPTGSLIYTGAGHNPPLLWRATTGAFEELRGGGTVLGVLPVIHLEDNRTTLHPADLLVMYTDGVTEAMNNLSQPFGLERLRTVVAQAAPHGADAVRLAIIHALDSFTGQAPQSDDITLLVIQRNP